MTYAKDLDTPRVPASLTKIMTALVARQWVDDASLDDQVTVTVDDSPAGPGAGGVALGDIVAYRDLFYMMLMTSRTDATHCLARNVGQLIVDGGGSGSSDPYTRFVEEMNIQALALGATSCEFFEPSGGDPDNRMSVRDTAMLFELLAEDAFLLLAAGTFDRPVTTFNGSPRTFDCINIFDPTGTTTPDVRVVEGYAFPEHVASKYGILDEAGFCLALIWDTPDAVRKVTVIMGSTDDTELKRDLRTVMNYEIG